jgi:peptidoglycan/xylan/chitin deacetylase (PgdA/CDA1 family)
MGMKTVFSEGLRQFTIKSALNVISGLGLSAVFPWAAGRGVIFTLHHVRPAIDRGFNPNYSLEITPEFLETAILTAKEQGLEPVHLEDLPELLKTSAANRKFVCFTLDDGYRNNAQFAAPIFRKYNVPYTIYVCPGFAKRQKTMWWETVAAILNASDYIRFNFDADTKVVQTKSTWQKQNAFFRFSDYVHSNHEDVAVHNIDVFAKELGIDAMAIVDREVLTEDELLQLSADPLVRFGGHTMCHCNLARIDVDQLREEIDSSCKIVSQYGNRPVTSFAYPYGGRHAAGPREFRMAGDLGLKIAVTTQPGIIKNNASEFFGMKRVSLNGFYQKKRYVKALASGLPYFGVS